ncbi:E3 ubiquitin-protein ligase Siah2-like [Macrosteles quadrilineatus]|uniref:E3 ubiquitin-protein ligase Siah2-like n=1 Tax=Macrosteles quadrilineatus TaxID=74068 RepID=UPI0023E1B7A9|nr:E3 ubiquitin-protein ligase Siah2-like [Macrosteles quadrilineatus]
MDKLSTKELRHSLDWLLQLALCPVCHETLTPAVVQCVRGHPVCAGCHDALPRAQQKCPQCRGDFSDNQSVFIQQVIESLPHPCRHQGCNYFVKTKDDHEKFCPYKCTSCRYCDWTGPSNSILAHLSDAHGKWVNMFLAPESMGELGMGFNPMEEVSVFTPIIADGHFFWGEMKNEPEAGKLTAIFHPLPSGKTTSVFRASVKLNRSGSYRADVKINMDPEANASVENCISIPTSILHKFTSHNRFEYRITVTKMKLESMYGFVQSTLEIFKK